MESPTQACAPLIALAPSNLLARALAVAAAQHVLDAEREAIQAELRRWIASTAGAPGSPEAGSQIGRRQSA